MRAHPTTTRAKCVLAALLVALQVGCAGFALPPSARAAVAAGAASERGSASPQAAGSSTAAGGSLESAASKAGSTGRKVAMSLIGLAFAVAGVVLAFRRDFKEAAGVFAVGIVAVLLATPAGIDLLQNTVSSLVGSR